MKADKKIFVAILALCMVVTAFPVSSYAKDAVGVQKVKWEDDDHGNGIEVDIDFSSRVQWKNNAKVSAKDNKGNTYDSYLEDRDDDECEIYIDNAKSGRTYTVKITGIRKRGASSYGSVSVKVKVPSRNGGLSVRKVDYDEDYDDDEYTVDIEFNKKISHKSDSCVLIKDSKGKSYSAKDSYVEWDDDECEVYLSKPLEYGKTYSYEIINVKAKGQSKYTTLKGSFKAGR